MIRKVTMAKLKPDKVEQYVEMHRNAWPEVKKEMAEHHHSNHSVYRKDNLLFQYFEYTGDDFEKDMEEMRANPVMQKWWALCRECVAPFYEDSDIKWVPLEEIFYNGGIK